MDVSVHTPSCLTLLACDCFRISLAFFGSVLQVPETPPTTTQAIDGSAASGKPWEALGECTAIDVICAGQVRERGEEEGG